MVRRTKLFLDKFPYLLTSSPSFMYPAHPCPYLPSVMLARSSTQPLMLYLDTVFLVSYPPVTTTEGPAGSAMAQACLNIHRVSCVVIFINYKYRVSYLMLNISSVVPSHLAISEVVPEKMPPRRMMPSSTSQLEWYCLLYFKVWLLVHPADVSW